jgi:hypothetical protein
VLCVKYSSEARWRAATRADADAAKFVAIFGDDTEMREAA